MSLENIAAVFYFAVFVSLIFMVKRILDSEKILDNHPYFRNVWLRIFLMIDIIAPLSLVITPEHADLSHPLFAFGLAGTFLVIGIIYNRHVLKVAITLSHTPEGNMVSPVQYLSFRSDQYTQLAPGLFVRRATHAKDILFGNYEEHLDVHLPTFDFEKEIVLIIRHGEEAEFAEHWHKGYERFLPVVGSFVINGTHIGVGDTYTVPPNTPHDFTSVDRGVAIIGLENK